MTLASIRSTGSRGARQFDFTVLIIVPGCVELRDWSGCGIARGRITRPNAPESLSPLASRTQPTHPPAAALHERRNSETDLLVCASDWSRVLRLTCGPCARLGHILRSGVGRASKLERCELSLVLFYHIHTRYARLRRRGAWEPRTRWAVWLLSTQMTGPVRCSEHASEALRAFRRAGRETLTIQKLTRYHPATNQPSTQWADRLG